MAEDENCELMIAALKAKDVRKKFDTSHTLNGVYANLGLTPIYHKSAEIVEPLRAGNCENLLSKAQELMLMNKHLRDILNGN